MSAMKNYLMDKIDELAQESGYSTEFLLETWLEQDELSWEDFVDATLDQKWLEAPADVLWMITVSPDCKKPVVHCTELEEPQPFAVTIMSKDFTGLPELVADAFHQLDGLRREVSR